MCASPGWLATHHMAPGGEVVAEARCSHFPRFSLGWRPAPDPSSRPSVHPSIRAFVHMATQTVSGVGQVRTDPRSVVAFLLLLALSVCQVNHTHFALYPVRAQRLLPLLLVCLTGRQSDIEQRVNHKWK